MRQSMPSRSMRSRIEPARGANAAAIMVITMAIAVPSTRPIASVPSSGAMPSGCNRPQACAAIPQTMASTSHTVRR